MTPSLPWSISATRAPSRKRRSKPPSRRTPKPPTTSNFSSAPRWQPSGRDTPVVAGLALATVALALAVHAVILSAAKDPDAPHPASISRIFLQRFLQPRCTFSHKNKFQKTGKFQPQHLLSFPATFSPQINHDLPRKKPRFAAGFCQ